MTPVTPSPDTSPEPGSDQAAPAARRRAPRRPGKPDAVLAAAVAEARAGLLEVAAEEEVGEYVGAVADAERLVTHRFAALRPGYRGWQWYSTVARMPRSKKVTVSEVGLLPSEDSLLAPEWVPWSDRLRPEDIAAEQEQQAKEQAEQEARDALEQAEPRQDGQQSSTDATGAGEDD
ncbi:DUF3027 domain-containing protein [Arthrobacter zhangbolii]|uniref:DUF3027 domain-containing protein n=1 Tax=Arthrobacter zhangbolii TaxID=2886936 RepID=A0A9X1M9K1_9MICC|nr:MULTISPECIES: DUF3027 domain-containing protein [Arthrobacter]MCC3273410.1 DUF3027 domain-containing protein [Arthrobacter zhangbolii]MDN3905691.1 DUF3027 domain-containing protein [Arthrobacter sp. YD2]UON93566.1 DUF3027 domain-containing protein [Arthrobacter zhangbolii]